MASSLSDFSKKQEFYVGIDSDGCVFDSMEIKHKECFCPQFIKHFGLQAASTMAREAWEFVNLYSKSRGVNRFKAVLQALDLLRERPEVARRGVEVPEMKHLRAWVEREEKLGNPALEKAVAAASSPEKEELQRALDWSHGVNAAVADIVSGVPPFPYVQESLQRLDGKADVVVVSQTPAEALVREWAENGIDRYVALIAGQELGKKSEHLIKTTDGNYEKGRVLMVGDAPGDLKAARDAGALFFPVVPGNEEESWKRFDGEALDRFFNGSYAGDYEESLLAEFEAALPETPPWK